MIRLQPETRSLVVVALLAATCAPGLVAQQVPIQPAAAPPVAPGARVRVTLPGSAPRVGTLVALTRDSLVARWTPGDSSALPLGRLAALEVSRGKQGRFWRGFGIGLLTGAAVGAAVGAVSYEGCDPEQFCIDIAGSAGGAAAGGAVVVGAAGGLVGGLIGALNRSERWQPATLPQGRVGLARPPRGTGVGVAVAF